ncbi:MAG: TonB-dependent receptor [Candidatus Omnitrophica bacterium]|nr:TonB-dependent receptor [Candidatus Omnitrophota bacterium]
MKKALWVVSVFLGVLSSVVHAESVDLETIVITPSRVGEPAGEASSNVTVITRQQIDRSGALSIPDVLEMEAGVSVSSQNSPKNKIVDIRGQGDTALRDVLVLVNGRRINPVDSSGPDWLQVPMETIERIEIIRGAASVAYGDNANAGVVNIITRSGRDEAPYAQVESEFGSYGFERYGVQTGGQKDKLSYYLYSGYSDLDGYRVNSGLRTRDGQGRVGYKVNDQVRFDIEGSWHDDDYRLPGGISAAWIAQHGRRSSDSPNDYANSIDRFVRISSEFKPVEADGSFGTLFLDYSHRDRDTFGALIYTGGSSESTRDIISDTVGVKYVLTPKLLGRDLRLTSGVDLSDIENTILTNSGTDLLIRKKEAGVYLLSDYSVTDRLSVNAGTRWDQADYIFDQKDIPTYVTRCPRVTASSGGIKYEYAPGSNVFASAAQTFRLLATDEWFSEWTGLNTSLKNQEGVEYQLGVVHHLDALRIDLTGFDIHNKNEIFVDPTIGFFGDNSNYERTERRGLELGLDLDLRKALDAVMFKSWDVFANATLQQTRFEGGAFDSKTIPFVPQEQFKMGTNFTFNNGLGFDVLGRYTGSQFPINDTSNERPRVKPTVVCDARARFVWKSSQLYAGINNVFDEKYYDYVAYGHSSGNTDYYPAAGRNFIAGFKQKF